MYDTHFTTGMQNLKKIDGAAGIKVIESLNDIAPDLGRYIVEFALAKSMPAPVSACRNGNC